jgi:hypothetical protein
MDDHDHPAWADPKFWAPFIVVGEPAKRINECVNQRAAFF